MYTTLAAVQREIRATGNEPDGNAALWQAILFVHSRINAYTRNRFEPSMEARYYDSRGHHIERNPTALYLSDYLVELISLSDGDGTKSLSDVLLYPRSEPHYKLVLKDGTFAAGDTWLSAVTVNGVWCYREDYSRDAWIASGDTLQASLNLVGTTIAVNNAQAADSYGNTPRFSAGNVIRVDDEYMLITSVTDGSSGDVLNVRRGHNGSSTATHDSGAAIDVFHPQDDIVRAATLWASYLFARRGRHERTTFDGVATVNFPQDAPDEVTSILDMYKRLV